MSQKISDLFTPVSNKQQQFEPTSKNSLQEKVKNKIENFKDYSQYKIRECSVVIQDWERKVIKKVIENPKPKKIQKRSRADLNRDDVESDISFQVSKKDVKLDPKVKNTDNSESNSKACENQNAANLKV